jgi:hypothetical protein
MPTETRRPRTRTDTETMLASGAGDPRYCHWLDDQLQPLCSAGGRNAWGWTPRAAAQWHEVEGGGLDDDVCKQCGRPRCPRCQEIRRDEY